MMPAQHFRMMEKKPLEIKDEEEYNDDEFEEPEQKKEKTLPKAILPGQDASSRAVVSEKIHVQPAQASHKSPKVPSLKSNSIQSEAKGSSMK